MSLTYQRKQVSAEKTKRVKEIKDLIESYDKILLLDIEGVPTPIIQDLREQLWDTGKLRVIKNSLTKIAIEELDRADFNKLKEYLNGMRAIFVTNDDIFKIARIVSSKSEKLPPKTGKKPSRDIIIEEGGTGLKTGPEMRDLRTSGLPIRIIENEIFVKERTKLVGKNEEISPSDAKAMRILDIKPIEAKVDIVIGLKDRETIPRVDLIRPLEEYKEMLTEGINKAVNFAVEVGVPTKATIDHQLRRAFQISLNFGLKAGIVTPETVEGLISNAYKVAQKVQEEIPTPK